MAKKKHPIFDEETLTGVVNKYLPEDKQVSEDKEDALIEFMSHIGETITENVQTSKEENIEKSKEWLALAKSNLKSSKVLHNNKQYADSIMLLQQSVEKLVKGYCLAFFICTEKDLRKVSHKTPLAFVKMIEQDWVGPCVEVMKSKYPSLNTNTQPLVEAIHTKGHELAQVNGKVITAFIDVINKIDKALGKKNNEVKEFIQLIVDDLDELMEEEDKKKFMFLKENFDIRLATSFIGLYLMSGITYPHITYARYPDGKVKPNVYNMRLGIVKKAPDIFKVVQKSIKQLDNYLGMKNG